MRRFAVAFSSFVLFLSSSFVVAQPPGGRFGGGPGRGPGGPGGPGGGPDLELVDQFDQDKNGRLNSVERKAALKHLSSQSRGLRGRGPGGPGRRGGRGGEVKGSPGPKVSVTSVQPVEGDDLYDTSVLRTIFLTFENDDWEQELESFKPTDVEVPADMIVDGKTYREVGVSFRGSSSFFTISAGSKRSLNISLDFADDDQRIYGVKTLNLLNCNGDASMMSTFLYHDIASKKIATPRANFVKVVINGQSWGIYANVEQFNKDFLKRNYESKKGARWKVSGNPNADNGLRYIEGDLDAYKFRYTIKSKDDPKAWKDLVELTRLINQTPTEELDTALEDVLDVDGTLWFLAMDVASVNSDGYWTRASDYSIYQNKEGKFHILPHDMNEAFGLAHGGGPGGPGGPGRGPGGRGGPPGGFGFGPRGFGPPGDFGFGPPRDEREGDRREGPEQRGDRGQRDSEGLGDRGGPRGDRGGFRGGPGGFGGRRGGSRGGPGGPSGRGPELDPLVGLENDRFPLRSKLLANKNLRQRYLKHVHTIASQYLDWKYLGPKVQAARELIGSEVKADTRKLMTYEAFEKVTDDKGTLYDFCTARAKYLLNCPAIKELNAESK